ncbi:UPF0056 inner membrane protein [Amylibacter marinus]|uniref:UPF0056 membrane protein n=1 Tax=Amylibacter marinus TaxID=1475483 RepID=A0ABQ5VW08_9RHOB|nr:MarC family protein [Amylibacter marinus]GLQ35482.1 UPF0056 inner membrane protein [Amylibacter marinus]
MLEFYITSFVTLFLIIDPLGLLPMYISVTQGFTRKRNGIGLRACVISAILLAVFAMAGEKVLSFIGIGMPAFRISGGLLLFLTAVEMLFNKRSQRREEQSEDEERDDPSVFPLATPLIAGPGSMAAVILLSGETSTEFNATLIVMAAMVTVLILTYLFFMMAGAAERMLGKTGINVITRLMGLLLAALSVQFVVDGVKDLIVMG